MFIISFLQLTIPFEKEIIHYNKGDESCTTRQQRDSMQLGCDFGSM